MGRSACEATQLTFDPGRPHRQGAAALSHDRSAASPALRTRALHYLCCSEPMYVPTWICIAFLCASKARKRTRTSRIALACASTAEGLRSKLAFGVPVVLRSGSNWRRPSATSSHLRSRQCEPPRCTRVRSGLRTNTHEGTELTGGQDCSKRGRTERGAPPRSSGE